MKLPIRKKICWRFGTQAETLAYLHLIDEKERPFCYFPDGNKDAIRVQINRDNNELLTDDGGEAKIVAPWLLSNIFSL